jgi:hypothetical protein
MPLLCISEINIYFYALPYNPSLLSKDGLNICAKARKNPNQEFIKNSRQPANFCTMRKASFLSVLVFLAFVCSAQEAKWGIFGGPQISSARYTINGDKQQTSAKYGFQLGTNWKVPFENKLYFSPAIFYSLKGYKVELTQMSIPPDSLAIDNNTTIHTLEFAALLQYDFNTQPNHFFVKLGPSLDAQIAGKEKFTRSDRTTVEQKMNFDFTEYGYFGANILVLLGYETKSGFQYSIQYTHGIGSINNADKGPAIWHRALGISLGKYLR